MPEKTFINILIAEDNQISRELMAKVLTSRGFNILHAADGNEAIELLQDNVVDLAIVDINMAPMGGFEFLKYMLVQGHDIPLVVVTADESSDLLVEASNLGVSRVLQKPVEPQRLIDTAVHILKRRGLNPDHMGVQSHESQLTGSDLMKRAIELADKNYKSGKGGPYGAVVADEKGKILGEGVSGALGRADPTAHAEVMAIRQAAEKLGRADLKDCVLYVSSEPTMMGKALIISVGLPKVYFGLSHEEIKVARQSEEKVRQAFDNEQVDTAYEQLEHEEAMDMFQSWLSTQSTNS